MRMQRHPDGANAWTLFIWGRHPRWSLTWTHSLTLTKHRSESGQRRFGAFRILGPQTQYVAILFGFALRLTTQKALHREARK
jgi:hypothetical protein